MTVADSQDSDCKKTVAKVAELEERLDNLETAVGHLHRQSTLLFVMAFCALLGLLAFLMHIVP
jgi:hypothetical protein